MSWKHSLKLQLEQRRQSDLFRQRRTLSSPQGTHVVVDGRSLLNFSSNDYLGLAALSRPALDTQYFGSGASHLVCGHSQAHQDLEEALARAVGYPRALLFANGYMANLALMQSLVKRGDVILQDKLNHASLIDGALLSSATLSRYRHLDYQHLQQQIDHHQSSRGLIATDAVFSMDGDQADLRSLSLLARQADIPLIIDDAHGFGTLLKATPQGKYTGSTHWQNQTVTDVPVYMGTLGKALGGYGAFIAAEDDIIEYLVQFARPYIYTTALPPVLADVMLQSLNVLMNGERQQRLDQLIRYFKAQANQADMPLMPSDTAIQPLLLKDDALAVSMSEQLLQQGLLVTAIRPPTVPKGSARLRITLSASHTENDVDYLISTLTRIRETENAA